MEKFFLYKKETKKPHFVLAVGQRAWIVPFLAPFEVAKKRLAIEVDTDNDARPLDSDSDLVESGEVVVNNEGEGKIDFTVVSSTGSIMNGGFVFVLPSWGRNTNRRLWLLVKSKKANSQGEKQC